MKGGLNISYNGQTYIYINNLTHGHAEDYIQCNLFYLEHKYTTYSYFCINSEKRIWKFFKDRHHGHADCNKSSDIVSRMYSNINNTCVHL